MFEFKVILREIIDVACNMTQNLLRVSVISEVHVVNKDLDRKKRPCK
jgi:hypothetical protein